jgi:hypothetical protein
MPLLTFWQLLNPVDTLSRSKATWIASSSPVEALPWALDVILYIDSIRYSSSLLKLLSLVLMTSCVYKEELSLWHTL